MKPSDENELAAAVGGATGALAVCGGGTRPIGRVVEGDKLSVAGLTGISLYEPGAMTIVAAAGTPLADIEAALDNHGQRLAFEPMDHRGLLGTTGTPTIGGVVAANVSGPRRIQAGACRDFLLGVRFVDGQGHIVRNGGRVMKNVTGYDLVKLMAGSFGTLGVISEVALKVLPKPETSRVLIISGLSDNDAVRAMSMALGSPFEVTGAAHAPEGPESQPVTLLRIEGFESSVKYRAEKLAALLDGLGEITIQANAENNVSLWKWVRDVEGFYGKSGDVWRISAKPSAAPGIAARLDATDILYDWGGGLIWALLREGVDARARLGKFQGHATLVRGSRKTRAHLPVFQPQPAPIAAITAGLRARFDPRGIFNPGLMD